MKKINLSIPTPCHENWAAMTPNEQGRFCGACNKSFIDFTSMSDGQVIAFFKQPRGAVCGRLLADQLDRDIILPRKRLPWIKYFFQFALPAFLLSLKATAQTGTTKERMVAGGKPAVVRDTILTPMILGGIAPAPQMQPVIIEIAGRVIDINGEPVSFASVFIKGTQIGVQTNADGNFILKDKNVHGKILVASAVGFESVERKIATDEFVVLTMDQYILSGEVIITGQKKLRKKIGKEKPVSETKQRTQFVAGTNKLIVNQTPQPALQITNRRLKEVNIIQQSLQGRLGGVSVNGKPLTTFMRVNNLLKQKIDTAFSRFSIYPNPATANSPITINTKKLEKGLYVITVMAAAGEKIKTLEVTINQNDQLVQMPMPNASAAGVYFISLFNKKTNKIFVEKLIIQ